ncbi:hypothetical protein BDY19DRAFT_993245 [Irpex rosettiformis]|uniref:Uncharacterized protein n=1 Tax=Irpex rosettiformis TaxID=378272 RepID=A0ACB8U5T2_9APHY|nr:hypothetical protein BDY19DRAFT_993245 [Irpex rosettiformis]
MPVYGAPLVKRDNSTVKVVVPIVVIVSITAVIIVVVCVRHGLHTRMWRSISHVASIFGPATGVTARTSNGTRELTAQQLVASNGQGTQAIEATTARPARAGRRNRRTPSQISTRSLPVYMKEPGEQEVVIYRGPEDMEDMPVTTNVLMPAVMEAPDGSSVDLTEPRVYVPMPDSPHDMPLLAGDESLPGSHTTTPVDNSRSNLLQGHRSRPSNSTLASSDERHSVEEQPETDPRGDAPPYFEVVPLEELNSNDSGALTPAPAEGTQDPLLPQPDNSADHTSPERQGSVRHHAASRLSGLFSIFHGRSGSSGMPSRVPMAPPEEPRASTSHRREDSDASLETSNMHLTRTRSRRAPSRSTLHRPSFSGSNSMLSVMTRSRSRLIDQANLTSPSLISVNSISAPLPHTLVRTEFTYPKTGPTPDQLKLISSREAFQRFGVPYGEEAIAFAASSSRVELSNVPPPEFEEIVRTDSRHESPLATNVPVTGQEDATTTEPEASGSSAHAEDESHSQPQAAEAAVEAETSAGNKQTETLVAGASTSGADSSASLSHPPGLLSSPLASTSVPESSQSSSSTLEVPIEASAVSSSSSSIKPVPVRPESRASTTLSFATADESIHATPLSSPAPTPYTSVSSRMTVPKVTVPTSHEVDDGDVGDEEEDVEVATPHDSSVPATPRTLHKSLSHSHENTTSTTNASIPPNTAVPPGVVAH